MEILPDYLIKDCKNYLKKLETFDENDQNLDTENQEYYENFEDHEEEKIKNYLESYSRIRTEKRYSFDDTFDDLFGNKESSMIEHIEETDYMVKEQEHKYKIFDDISSVIKNKNNKIELVLNIPRSSDVISINKIKLSRSIKDYIFDIFITLDNKKILSRGDLYNTKINFSNLKNYPNSINCSKGDIDIHIVLEPNSINEIINNNIYISFSYINYKNKNKLKICYE